ncbi:MAG: Type 1 glutamine amidotransferase-like domain-containing protein [Candidatus Portnoybacteria bacterium]
MKLFLTSAGLVPETTEAFLELLSKKPVETRVCFMATAADSYSDKWFVEKDKKRLEELGFKVTELDLKEENEASLNEKFKNFNVIFVEGGNTFYLLKYVKESGFDKALKVFLDRDGIYIGVSAGSYIAGPDISGANWKHADDQNTVGLKDLRGLGLVDFSISPHYVPEHEAIINENKSKVSCPIFALTDFQAILVDNNDIQFIGPGEFKRFN